MKTNLSTQVANITNLRAAVLELQLEGKQVDMGKVTIALLWLILCHEIE